MYGLTKPKLILTTGKEIIPEYNLETRLYSWNGLSNRNAIKLFNSIIKVYLNNGGKK